MYVAWYNNDKAWTTWLCVHVVPEIGSKLPSFKWAVTSSEFTTFYVCKVDTEHLQKPMVEEFGFE